MPLILYHNARCSKSRAAYDWLTSQSLPFETIDYLQNPPTLNTLRTLAAQLGCTSPRQMMRTADSLFTELGLDTADDEALFAALAAHPQLLQRPIAVSGSRAVIGRPLAHLQQFIQEYYAESATTFTN